MKSGANKYSMPHVTAVTDEHRHMTTKNTQSQLHVIHSEPADKVSAIVPSYLARHSLTAKKLDNALFFICKVIWLQAGIVDLTRHHQALLFTTLHYTPNTNPAKYFVVKLVFKIWLVWIWKFSAKWLNIFTNLKLNISNNNFLWLFSILHS